MWSTNGSGLWLILPSGDIGQCLETFFGVTAGHGSHWHLVVRGQGFNKHPTSTGQSPTT